MSVYWASAPDLVDEEEHVTDRAAVVSRALTMVASMVLFFNCWTNDGLWKATTAGSVLEMTRSHSWINSGLSLDRLR